MSPRPPRPPLLLLGLGAGLVLLDLLWISRQDLFLATDEAIHHWNALRLHRWMRGEGDLQAFLPALAPVGDKTGDLSFYYPPLPYLVAALAMFVAGESYRVADASVSLWLLLYLGALWALARHAGGRTPARLALLLAGTSPVLLSYSRAFFLEVPALAMVALAFLSLLRSRHFEHAGWSLAFAAAAAASLYCRWNAWFFLAAPTLWSLLAAIRRSGAGWRALLLLLPFLLGLAAIAAGWSLPWTPGRVLALYGGWALLMAALGLADRLLPRGLRPASGALRLGAALVVPLFAVYARNILGKNLVMLGAADAPGEVVRSQLAAVLWYARTVAGYFWLSGPSLLVGLALAWTRRWRSRLGPFAVAALGGFLLAAPIGDVNERYILPLLPFTAVLSTAWLGERRWLLPLAALVGLFQAAGWLVTPRRALVVRNVGTPLPELAALLPTTATRPEQAPLERTLLGAFREARRVERGQPYEPFIVVLDQRHVPSPVEFDWLRYLATASRTPVVPAPAYPPYVGLPRPAPVGAFLWLTSEPESYALLNHVLASRAGWELHFVQGSELSERDRAYLFAVLPSRHRNGRGPAELGEARGEGYAEGWIEELGERELVLDLDGPTVRWELGGPVDPFASRGSRALLRFRREAEGRTVVERLWALYYPSRFPPRRYAAPPGRATPIVSPAKSGRLLSLSPERLVIDAGTGPVEIRLGPHDVLLPDLLLEGERVGLAPAASPEGGGRGPPAEFRPLNLLGLAP